MDHLDLVASAWSLENGCWSLVLVAGVWSWRMEHLELVASAWSL
jgi:hypothetical protein